MGISALNQALKTLCLNTEWNYAVFWKLDPRTRMMLTCEDAYYDKNDPPESKRFDEMMSNLSDERFAEDFIGLAVANMSYLQYSLGEGVVGQVALTGNHMWITGDQLVTDPCLFSEDLDGWKIQFAAGIKTIAFVGVVPHGVVQLGSTNIIAEDLKMVNHIREMFIDLQSSLLAYAPSNTSSYNDTVTSINCGINNSYTISDHIPNMGLGTVKSQSEIDNMNTMKTSFEFPAGFELYEALGPAFYKQNDNYILHKIDEMPGTSSNNLLTPNSGSEHLLEAVVTNVRQIDNEFSNSVKFVETRFNDMQTSSSGCYSLESSLGFSSASHSRCSEPLERSQEPINVVKKRAKPGESSRPRPRDRQLIQDRIKELRELVPNGSKCSIDSLLERTIKHMLFMQSVTKHANKIDNYAESKLLSKETGTRGSSLHEQGSSWAMEVGNNMKVCPVTVENIGTNGQMLVEMMCEEGVHFLEIADAIRSLGLDILKGVTEPEGDKNWMCFVVEGQNNRNVHRMDVIWLLVQILQAKAQT
ncbi:transcription factor EMB1444-like [Rutidosis leptorrhynchoides]|uniref:transcription factor EMB1444-like n=1 Tax=Rutidosis leptorrhynchoides TaxID=125765 RepID=UPI003A9A4132